VKNILITRLEKKPVEELPVEIVERKGRGHPDYIADAIAEAASAGLSIEYKNRYGRILHHNVDKVLVVGGQALPKFGGGEVLSPIYILISGRATAEVVLEDGTVEKVPVGPVVIRYAKKWLRENFRFLDPEQHVVIDYKIGQGSADLVSVFEREKKYPLSNDTSLGVGFAPLSETERLVLEVESYLNSPELKSKLPAVGEDVKVMAVRRGDEIDLTVAVAVISRFVRDMDEYLCVKEEVREEVHKIAERITSRAVRVYVNTADDPESGSERSVYLVVTGTSAEHGDDGATGRGNRVNGLITPMRPMSMEATAGKNPVNHVGKIYNVLANRIAERIASIDGVREAYVMLLSQIGRPINDPLIASVDLVLEEGAEFASAKYEAEAVVEEELDRVVELTDQIVQGKLRLF